MTNYLSHYYSNKDIMDVEIKSVEGKGKGIFASDDYKKGEHILDITGEVIETRHPEGYPEEITEHWAPIGREGDKFRFIKPEPPWMYMNHSCDSNAGVINNRELIAKRDIKKEEEITTDYSAFDIEALTHGKKEMEMTCKCGNKNCRRKIKTFDQLSKKYQEKLKPYLNDYMKKKYL